VRGGCLDLALRLDRFEDVLFASCASYEQASVYRFPRAALRNNAEVVLREANMGRTSLAIALSNPTIIYALAGSKVPGPLGIYEQGLHAVYRNRYERGCVNDDGVANPRARLRPTMSGAVSRAPLTDSSRIALSSPCNDR